MLANCSLVLYGHAVARLWLLKSRFTEGSVVVIEDSTHATWSDEKRGLREGFQPARFRYTGCRAAHTLVGLN